MNLLKAKIVAVLPILFGVLLLSSCDSSEQTIRNASSPASMHFERVIPGLPYCAHESTTRVFGADISCGGDAEPGQAFASCLHDETSCDSYANGEDTIFAFDLNFDPAATLKGDQIETYTAAFDNAGDVRLTIQSNFYNYAPIPNFNIYQTHSLQVKMLSPKK